MIYVPDSENYKCFVVRNDSTIRAYKDIPYKNSQVNYRDYYYTSGYLYSDGIQYFSSNSSLPTCLDSSLVSSAYVYRLDFPQILLTFILLIGFVGFFISKLFKNLFFGFKRR